ncbi:MAG: dihydrofolate reductase family protein [Vampirovibrionales bacterium]|nr:dihydrofolate reductase family protein [Vampirovibrionales bacterium]
MIHVSACLATSLDGRLNWPDSDSRRIGSEQDLTRFFNVCQAHEAILTGAQTVRAFPKPLKANPYVHIILTQTGSLPWQAPLFASDSPARLWIASPLPPPNPLPQGVCRWIQTETPVTCIHNALTEANIGGLLIAGGGQVFSLWLNEDAIDTLHLTLTPHVMGMAASALCPMALRSAYSLRLTSQARYQDEIWLTYVITKHH